MNGLRVQICPQVFNPITGRTTRFFIQRMQLRLGTRVLEVGTGSGAIAAAAAQVSKFVCATDISPFAVRCAKATMRLNGIEDRVRVVQGDLFSPVQGETFDVILFNPPFFKSSAISWLAKAWAAGSDYELFNRFFVDARQMLSKTGEIQILLSSAASLSEIIALIRKTGYIIRLLGQGRILGFLERIFLFRLI
jgi:release factor glutamine methyltransferase